MAETNGIWAGQKKLLKQAFPLILLLTFNLFYHNTVYIILFISFMCVFDNVNDLLTRQISLQDQHSNKQLLMLCSYLFFVIYLAIPVIQNYWCFSLLELMKWSETSCSFWHVLFNVAAVDFIIKFATVALKAVIALLSSKVISIEKTGSVYLMCEGTSQFIRCLLPAPEWVKYIVHSSSCFATVVCWAIALTYILMKVSVVKSKWRLLRFGWINYKDPPVLGSPLSDGNTPTTPCPMCHRKFVDPVQLSCRHVFCKACCHLWFDRERECPACTSSVVFASMMGQREHVFTPTVVTPRCSPWKTGTTEYFVQLF